MYKLLIKFPNPDPNEKNKYFELMRGIFGQMWEILKHDRLSFEIHKIKDSSILFLITVSNQKLLPTIQNYLTSIDGISIEQLKENQDPVNFYSSIQPIIKRLILHEDYYALNCDESNFFKRVIDYLSSIEKTQSGSVMCFLRPVKKSKIVKIENEIRKRDEFLRIEANTTNLQNEMFSLNKKLSSNLFQAELYTLGSDDLVSRSLAGVFNVLDGGKNYFLIKKFIDLEKIKKRWVNKENFFNSLFRKWFLGSFLNAGELATMFHPSPLERGRYKAEESNILEARPEFLEQQNNNILIGQSILKTGKIQDIFYPTENLQRHIYLAGQTGVGKSTLIISLFKSLMEKEKNKALIMLDPHGEDLIEIALRTQDWSDLIYFNLAETEQNLTFTMNPLFSFGTGIKEKEAKIELIVQILQEESKERGQTLGTSLEKLLTFLIETGVHFADAYFKYLVEVMKIDQEKAKNIIKEKQLTLPDLLYVLKDSTNYKQTIQRIFAKYPHEIGLKWTQQLEDYFISRPIVDGVENRLRFIVKGTMTSFLEGNKFDLAELTKQKKKILIPVTKQSFGYSSRRVIAKLILSEIWNQTQQITREKDRQETVVFIDEFQTCQLPIIDDLLSEARKYKISMVLGNQYLGQLETDIKDSVLGNVSTLFSFNVGNIKEAREIRLFFKDKVEVEEMMSLPPFTAYMRTIGVDKQDTAFMTFKTVDYKKRYPEKKTFEELKALNEMSLSRYGENIDKLNQKHLAKMKDAEDYFLGL